MAIPRLSVKVGKSGKAASHAAYITRTGVYANRLDRRERLEAVEAGNMPAWAQQNQELFWAAADAYEREKGTTYREMEIALPRELTAAQRIELVREWVRQELGEKHAYQWAIHVPTAADGGEQPHAHVMFSEHRADRIPLDPEEYFGRYKKTYGGGKKGFGDLHEDLKGYERKEARRADVKALRARWEVAANAALERAGQEARISMASYRDRGIRRTPERKQLPSQWRGEGRAQVIEFRQARAESQAARRELVAMVPDMRGEVIQLERAGAGRNRKLEQMPLATLREYVAKVAPRPISERVAALSSVQAAEARHRAAVDALRALRAEVEQERRKHEQAATFEAEYRAANAWRVRLHDTGVQSVRKLAEAQATQQGASERMAALAAPLADAEREEQAARVARIEAVRAGEVEVAPAIRSDAHKHAAAVRILERRTQEERTVADVVQAVTDYSSRIRRGEAVQIADPTLRAAAEQMAEAQGRGRGEEKAAREALRAELVDRPEVAASMWRAAGLGGRDRAQEQ